DAKAAQNMEHEGDPGFLRKPRMAAGEHHAQLIVFDGVGAKKFFDDRCDGPFAFEESAQFWGKSASRALAPQHVERAVLCGGHQPRGGIFRYTAEFPNFKRTAEGVLYDVFCQCEVVDAKDARQCSDQTPRFAPEQMIVGIHYGFSFMTGRTSTA